MKAKLRKREVFTPMGKKDNPTYDVLVNGTTRTRAVSFTMGKKIVKRLNKL